MLTVLSQEVMHIKENQLCYYSVATSWAWAYYVIEIPNYAFEQCFKLFCRLFPNCVMYVVPH